MVERAGKRFPSWLRRAIVASMATFQYLARKLDELPDVFALVSNHNNPPSDEQIAVFEARTGRPFDPEHKKLLQSWGAFTLQVKEEVWPRPKEFDVLPVWRFWFGIEVLGLGELPPVLSMESALAENHDLPSGARPFLRRIGAGFLAIETATEVGRWTPQDGDLELFEGGVIDLILEEIAVLEEFVDRLREEQASVDELLELGAASGFRGPDSYRLVKAIEAKAADELAAQLARIVEATMPDNTITTLSIIQKAGPDAYPGVADRVHAVFEGGDEFDRQYAIACMGAMKDTSERAIACYTLALSDDNETLFSYALDAISEVREHPEVRNLAGIVAEAFDSRDFDDEEVRSKALGSLGRLGRDITEPLAGMIAAATDDEAFSVLVSYLTGVSLAPTSHDALLNRYHALAEDCESWVRLEVVEALVQHGIEERETMAEFLRSELAGSEHGAERARAILDRWE